MSQGLDELLLAAGKGDAQAWRGLIEAYSGRVYSLLAGRCGDRELAEELTQGTFVKVVGKLKGYREIGKFEAWLFRIAMNLLRDEMRRRKRQALSIDFGQTPPESLGHMGGEVSPDGRLLEKERHELLRRAVAKLPEPDREIIELRYTAELTFAQIAQTLDEPLGTVLARGHRALKKLRDLLQEPMSSRK